MVLRNTLLEQKTDKMATKNTNLSHFSKEEVPNASLMRFGLVVSNWNQEVTIGLLQGAKQTLLEYGALESNIIIMDVPGSFELVFGARIMAKRYKLSSIICLGSIIQGETKHFDFVCNGVSLGIKDLNMCLDIPVIFGVLTGSNMQQVIDRSGGKHGNKGVEAAVTAIKMAKLNGKTYPCR